MGPLLLQGQTALGFAGGQPELAVLHSPNPIPCTLCASVFPRLYIYNLFIGLCKECFTFALGCRKSEIELTSLNSTLPQFHDSFSTPLNTSLH